MRQRALIVRVKKNKKGKFFWSLLGANGRTLAHSEDYAKRHGCLQTAKMVFESLSQGTDVKFEE